MADLRPIPMTSRAVPGLHVSLDANSDIKPMAVIVNRHELAPHYVVGRIEVHSSAQIEHLIQMLNLAKSVLDANK
jgi:hypothetical protein